jgi:hypothetical protein
MKKEYRKIENKLRSASIIQDDEKIVGIIEEVFYGSTLQQLEELAVSPSEEKLRLAWVSNGNLFTRRQVLSTDSIRLRLSIHPVTPIILRDSYRRYTKINHHKDTETRLCMLTLLYYSDNGHLQCKPPGLIYRFGDHSDHPFALYNMPFRGSLYLQYAGLSTLAG